jgi:hypothetical protein
VDRYSKQVQVVQQNTMPAMPFMDMRPHYVVLTQPKRRYGFFSFVWDVFMVTITGGLWLIWIFVREMRRR